MRQPKNPEKRVLKAFGGLLYLRNHSQEKTWSNFLALTIITILHIPLSFVGIMLFDFLAITVIVVIFTSSLLPSRCSKHYLLFIFTIIYIIIYIITLFIIYYSYLLSLAIEMQQTLRRMAMATRAAFRDRSND